MHNCPIRGAAPNRVSPSIASSEDQKFETLQGNLKTLYQQTGQGYQRSTGDIEEDVEKMKTRVQSLYAQLGSEKHDRFAALRARDHFHAPPGMSALVLHPLALNTKE